MRIPVLKDLTLTRLSVVFFVMNKYTVKVSIILYATQLYLPIKKKKHNYILPCSARNICIQIKESKRKNENVLLVGDGNKPSKTRKIKETKKVQIYTKMHQVCQMSNI